MPQSTSAVPQRSSTPATKVPAVTSRQAIAGIQVVGAALGYWAARRPRKVPSTRKRVLINSGFIAYSGLLYTMQRRMIRDAVPLDRATLPAWHTSGDMPLKVLEDGFGTKATAQRYREDGRPVMIVSPAFLHAGSDIQKKRYNDALTSVSPNLSRIDLAYSVIMPFIATKHADTFYGDRDILSRRRALALTLSVAARIYLTRKAINFVKAEPNYPQV